MGSEGKSRKRRSSLSPSPSQEEAEKGRKHWKRDGEERRRNRDDDEDDDRKKKTKKTKSSDRSHKEKKSREKHGKHMKKNSDSFVELSKDDYFSKNNEFSTWLKEEKGLYFSDLSSGQARDQFSVFMKDWNNHKLDSRYYEGIASGPRTAHNWKIRKDN
ncbi:putative style cell-cycle inhibitor 1 [Dioscorea sansibarensis]